MDRVILVFSNFEDASKVHAKLFRIGNKNNVIYYKDVCDVLDIVDWYESRLSEYNLECYGWTSLCDVQMIPSGDDRWIIVMPEMKKINNKRR